MAYKSKPIVAKNEPIGVEVEAGKEYRWCTCGRSKEQPFCDDACAGTAFKPHHFTAKEDGEVWLCRCKQTHDAPYCDGHHAQVKDAEVGKKFALDDYQYSFSKETAEEDEEASAKNEKKEEEERKPKMPEPHPTEEEPTVAFIHKLAKEGLRKTGPYGKMGAMGVPRKDLPDWNDIQFMTAQLARQPLMEEVPVDTELVIGPAAKKPLRLKIPLFVSDMSFGSLSEEAKLSLARGAEMAGTGICSGEGGMLPEEQAANSRYFYEYASAKFGYDENLLSKVQAFHFKAGQAAKTGTGGHLPGKKNRGRISEIRGLTEGENADSPPTFTDLHTVEDFARFADHIRKITGGIPIGFKMSAQHVEQDIEFAVNAGADYIILDGRGGGTGDAPLLFRDHISVPTIPALARARQKLDTMGVGGKVSLLVTGGLRLHTDFAKALALGADGVALANSAMQAIGCIAARMCNTDLCPSGIATQDPERRKKLDVGIAAKRLHYFFEASIDLMKVMARACGHDHLNQFNKNDLASWHKDLAELAGIEWSGYRENR